MPHHRKKRTREWDTLSELALQLVDSRIERGTEGVISALLEEAENLEAKEQANVARFPVRAGDPVRLPHNLKDRIDRLTPS